jgi:hypothetical protein
LTAATIEYAAPPVHGNVDPDPASILQVAGQTDGAIILPAFSSVDDSDYFDLLAISSLTEDLERGGRDWVAVTVTTSDNLRRGAFILGLAEADARKWARAYGQPAFLVVDAAGKVAVRRTFA